MSHLVAEASSSYLTLPIVASSVWTWCAIWACVALWWATRIADASDKTFRVRVSHMLLVRDALQLKSVTAVALLGNLYSHGWFLGVALRLAVGVVVLPLY